MESNAEATSKKWGMVVDLDRCTGCGACVTACAMENNIPSVREEEAAYGRNLHWLRIQRYWEGEYPHVRARYMPVMCQQCGAAPCEVVCPVFAAVHSMPDAVNVQVYNRCVGTRFCAVNCPYVARVFNYFNYPQPESFDNYLNPDVTRRSRGIMEKCTFCIHRIHRAEEDARLAGRELEDGEVQPACVQVCPTNALVFGKLTEPESEVSKFAQSDRAMQLLEDLGTLPRVYYLKAADTPPRFADGASG